MYQPSGRSPVALGVDADRLGEVGALLRLRHVLVVDPFEAVAGDFPARFLHRCDRLRVARERAGDAEHRRLQVAAGEQPPEAPEPCTRAVFIHRLDVHVTLTRPRYRAKHVGQECFRCGVAMQDVALAAFLVVDHELHGDTRATRPARIGRVAAVTDEIARVAREIGRWHRRVTLLAHRPRTRPPESGALAR